MPDFADAVKVTEFWRLVNIRGDDDCWPWAGYAEEGYGRFYFRGKMMGAHELALSFTTGEQRAAGLDSCHSCNNPICCNPRHLRFDTRASNVRDMVGAGRCANGTSKLGPDEVLLMRTRRAGGAAQKDLAKQYGISEGQVSMIIRGLRWPDVGGPIQTERKYHRVR